MIETYNTDIARWIQRENREVNVDNFVESDETKISWSAGLKLNLQRGKTAVYTKEKIRAALYRPFTKTYLYFDRMLNERIREYPYIFPKPETDRNNQVICAGGYGRKKFAVLMSNSISDLNLYGDPQQSFPFYTYDEDGTNRKENITDWALTDFQNHYNDDTITKWDIFHYTYALLHHPDYRQKYEMNLKRDLPHIPYAPDFREFANAGARLADIHVNYETQPIYDGLEYIETADIIDWRVEKMKLSKDKTQLKYNDFLTITGIPEQVYDYRLGTRSALEWVIDQYRVKTDKRSGIINDPNRPSPEDRYIVDLIGRVITVSLHTVDIIKSLPPISP